MYDIVGKRNWFFLFSALITIPGIVFILLGGLKPSVDFTGGTGVAGAIRRASRRPRRCTAALVELGIPRRRRRRADDGYLRIRTEPIDLLPPQTPLPTVSLVPSASGAASADLGPERRRPPASPTPARVSLGLAPIPTQPPSGRRSSAR